MSETNIPIEDDAPVVMSDTGGEASAPPQLPNMISESAGAESSTPDTPNDPQNTPAYISATAPTSDDTARPWHGAADPWEAMYRFVVGEIDALKAKIGG